MTCMQQKANFNAMKFTVIFIFVKLMFDDKVCKQPTRRNTHAHVFCFSDVHWRMSAVATDQGEAVAISTFQVRMHTGGRLDE